MASLFYSKLVRAKERAWPGKINKGQYELSRTIISFSINTIIKMAYI